MKDQVFEIPGRLAGMNELYGATLTSRYAGGSIKKKETRRCAEACLGLNKIDYPIKLTISWFEPNSRRDIDNVAAGIKFILDGLVQAGKLSNDGRKQVQAISHEFPSPCPKNPRVVVWIQEYIGTL